MNHPLTGGELYAELKNGHFALAVIFGYLPGILQVLQTGITCVINTV